MHEGLEGVVAASTRLSHVDGEAGRLTIAGYAVEDLAPNASFEDVAYLLLQGRLPEPSERVSFAQDLARRRALPRAAIEVLREAAAAKASGLPTALFTPTFAVGRVLGWSAHCLEQLRDGRLIRPQSAYIGPTDLHYNPRAGA